MRKKIFLVDSENISDYSFIKNYNISDTDEIVIFASAQSKSIKMEYLEDILECRAKISFEWVETGSKNELDFQLVAYLGINLNKCLDYYIVSKDCGFDGVVSYIKKKCKNVSINTIKDISNVINNKAPKETISKRLDAVGKSIVVDKYLTPITSDKLRCKVKARLNNWVDGKLTYQQVKKCVINDFRSHGLYGETPKKLCVQILTPIKDAMKGS